LPIHIVKIIEPILEELGSLENGLGCIDRDEFLDAMSRLYAILNSKEKEDLFSYDKPPLPDP
jgi:hypothetical protein